VVHEVHRMWRLLLETLYFTVNIVDRYLAMKEVSKKTLQLVGSSALLIASKYEEIYPTPVGDLVYVCDGAYDNDEVSECPSARSYFAISCTLIIVAAPEIGRCYGREDAEDPQLPNQHSDYL